MPEIPAWIGRTRRDAGITANPRSADPERGAVRVWAWALAIAAGVLWLLEVRYVLTWIPYDLGQYPSGGAPESHHQIVVTRIWCLLGAASALLAGTALGALAAGAAALPGRRACAAAFGAFLAVLAFGLVGGYYWLDARMFGLD